MIDYKRMGENLKAFRKSNKLTRKNFAQLIKSTSASISNYENGTRKIPIELLYNLKSLFSIDLNSIFTGITEKEANEIEGLKLRLINEQTKVRLLKDLLKMEDTEFGSKEENL